jgi:hypothetical protein
MAVIIPSEAGHPLDLTEGESFFRGFWRAPISVQIVGTTLTLPGSGRYTVLPPSGTSGTIGAIVLSTENVVGALIQLYPETIGHTILITHAGNLHLLNGSNVSLTTIWSSIWLRHHGGGVFAQEGPLNYVP